MSLKECRNDPVTECVENFHAITDQASELFALTLYFLLIFASISLKLDKVASTFSSFNLYPSFPSVAPEVTGMGFIA